MCGLRERKEVVQPEDRVLTVMHREHQSSICSRSDAENTERYRSDDAKLVAELLATSPEVRRCSERRVRVRLRRLRVVESHLAASARRVALG